MKVLTSEQVFRGHPDKVCDQISDAILDACLEQDKKSRVAVETLIKDDFVVIAGEVTTKAIIDYESIALEVLKDIGVEGNFNVLCKVSEQSEDIAIGVDKEGAGDQGIMYGYACNETEELMPLPVVLSKRIAMRMDELSREYKEYFGVDGKCQVSVEYDDEDRPVRVSSIIISQQTKPRTNREFYVKFIIDECINKVVPNQLIRFTDIKINPTGEFVKGGSFADCGLTGRKIICDTYGGIGKHGGGAFSGKDYSKVDRSAAYYARYVAKALVGAKIALRCEVSVAYSIGVKEPVSININTFGTSFYSDEEIKKVVEEVFDFSTTNIKSELSLDSVKYYPLAAYGHFGRLDLNVPWEELTKIGILKEKLSYER